MKITGIDTFPVLVPLKPERHLVTSLGEHTESQYLLIRVETSAGIEGVGEATVSPRWSGETIWSARAIIERLFAPRLLGRDPRDIHAVETVMDREARHNWFAKSAIEMACWDIRGKECGKPVYELLGGAVRPLKICCRYSMGAYEPRRAARRAADLVDEGFTTIKVKVGTVLDEDVERVRAVREAIGRDNSLVIDANCGWDAPTAIHAITRMEPYNVALCEQPTTDGDFGALAEVRRAIKPEVMADDIVFDLVDARECIRNAACDVVAVYPGKCAGIRKTKEIVEYCGGEGVPCSIGSNLELDVATAAMCHVVVASRNMQVERYPGDILGPDYHEFSIAANPIRIEGPHVTIADRPGLGVDVDWATVEAHACA